MEQLAIDGGLKACPAGTFPAWPQYDQTEEAALLRTLHSGFWWRIPGREVDAFERDFARFHDVEHALCVTNGTQAIELALDCMDIGVGDEVIVPAFTFAATLTAVLHAGATPVVVDVELDTYCMSMPELARAITPRTRAVIPVHLAGHACDMDAILSLARKHGLRVIGDGAHAHGARWRGESLARLADACIYSFQSGKLMTAGEGGALLTRDASLAERAWLKASCGRPRSDVRYEHVELGTNMRMGEFHGALLGAQLVRFPAQLEERERGAARLDERMRQLPGLHVQERAPGVTTHSHYMYMVRVDETLGIRRDELVQALIAEGVPAYFAYKALPDLPFLQRERLWAGNPPDVLSSAHFREAIGRHEVPHARRLGAQSLWLHHSVLLGGERVQSAVVHAFAKVLAGLAARSRPSLGGS